MFGHERLTIDSVAKLSKRQKVELFAGDADPFRVGSALAGFPFRRPDEYLLLMESGRAVGMQGLSLIPAVLNGVRVALGCKGGYYVAPKWRGTGVAPQVHAYAMNLLLDRGAVGAMAFCKPELVDYYERIGASEVSCPVMVPSADGTLVPSSQSVIWWPFDWHYNELSSVDLLGSLRW